MNLKKKLQNGSICIWISNCDGNLYDYNNWDGDKDILRLDKKRQKWLINNHQVVLKNY